MASGIVGWVGCRRESVDPADQLERMLAAIAGPGTVPSFTGCRAVLEIDSALASQGLETREWRTEPSGLWVAVEGALRWRDPGLAGIARERGAAAALAHGYTHWGEDVLSVIGGRFRFVLVDPHRRRAMLAVDRVGSMPLCYARTVERALVFSTSLDAFRAHGLTRADVSPQALLDYFHFQVVYGPETVYENVSRLLPAQRLVFSEGQVWLSTYWTVPYAAPRRVTSAGRAELRVQLREVVRRSVASAVEREPVSAIGSFLSGGLDSSGVLGLATREVGRPLPSYTIRFDVDGFDESYYATLAARQFESPNHLATLTPDDAVRALPLIANAFDQPFGNASAIGVFHCARQAAEHGVRTLLAGDGGDELFAGSDFYTLMQKFETYARLPRSARTAVELALGAVPRWAMPSLFRRARSYVRRASIPMPARMRTYAFLEPKAFRRVFTPDFLASVDPQGPLQAMERIYGRTQSPSVLQRQLHYALHTIVASNDVPKVSGMCAWAGVQARFPLLDEELIAFTAQIPPNVLVRRFRARELYREVLRDLLPAPIIVKEKHCFAHPIGAWIAGPTVLRGTAITTLHEFSRRGIVSPRYVEELLADPRLLTDPDHAALVWYMVVLEHWLKARESPAWSTVHRAPRTAWRQRDYRDVSTGVPMLVSGRD